MDEEDFTETVVGCVDCGTEFHIMVHEQRGETVTICENCMSHMEVIVEGGDVAEVQPTD